MKMRLTYDKGATRAVIREHIMTRARRAFNRAVGDGIVAAVSQMAVRSGMSAASWLPLAREFRHGASVQAIISGKNPRFENSPYQGDKYGYGPDGLKSQAHGARLGENAYLHLSGTTHHPVFSVEFEIMVLQYAIHEATWDSLDNAVETFEKSVIFYAEQELDPDEIMNLIIGATR